MIVSLLAVLMVASSVQSTQVGERHPDFMLPTIEEDGFGGLVQYRGKKVLLINFASW